MLAPPYEQFYSYPCLNPPRLNFEFGGWSFPVLRGGSDDFEVHGGRLSLGKVVEGSGYCVGAVVETRMGVEAAEDRARSKRSRSGRGTVDAGGNGLRDVWVLGEVFFRGVTGVFDVSSPPSSLPLPTILAPR